MSRKLFGPGLGGLASSGEAWLVIHWAVWPPVEAKLLIGARLVSGGLREARKGTQVLTWPVAHLDFRLREGRREEKQRLVPAPGDTLSRWGCLLGSSWLPGTAWLAGAFHLLALGSQAVEQEE